MDESQLPLPPRATSDPTLPPGTLTDDSVAGLQDRFEAGFRSLF